MSQRKIVKKVSWMVGGASAALVGIPAIALQTSVGEIGIDARRLHEAPYNLTGRKIAIAQVDIGRPRKFGLDKEVHRHRDIPVRQVFLRDAPAKTDPNQDPRMKPAEQHAENVAAVMVSSDKALPGVAPGATLYAAAIGLLQRSGQPEECLAAQNLAEQNGGDVRAINYSFGESLEQDPRPNAVLDGNALLTQCLDWSARVHNVLHVVAGNQGRGGIPIPTDNFNGMNVAFSTLYEGTFSKVDLANIGSSFSGFNTRLVGLEGNVDGRRAISVVAPGSNLDLLSFDGRVTRTSGTSFAAPHVTATVALLQEYGDRQLRRNFQDPQWTLSARRHEVMKAVLMNSAEKIADPGTGEYLDMKRTLLADGNRNWLDSDAYKSQSIPLDGDLGTGHLDAYRAYQQFSAGQWGSDAPVPTIGWDYRSVEEKSYRDYVIDAPLQAGSVVSVTLAWNRWVDLVDGNDNGQYDIGETFRDRGLNNLDVYLMPAEEEDTSKSIWSSVSDVDSVEHIFHAVPKTGRYKIRVQFRDRVNDEVQPYAIAWWTAPAR
ncbi:S8 family serine peptidase [Phormidium sp. CCY1219]|uniref:S8 family serine peptidase n=1 Tax=Phormidium sp. CCY1219 TaxID=2886104 RepID=UPI002D787384|nr:S8 family serine peptidase [Phormidium sp. CCY1219]